MTAGSAETVYSASVVLQAERKNRRELGKLADLPIYNSIQYPHIKKVAAIRNLVVGCILKTIFNFAIIILKLAFSDFHIGVESCNKGKTDTRMIICLG